MTTKERPPIGVLCKMLDDYEAEEILALRARLPMVAGPWTLERSDMEVTHIDDVGVETVVEEVCEHWDRPMNDDEDDVLVGITRSTRKSDGSDAAYGPKKRGSKPARPYEALAYDDTKWCATLEEAQDWCDQALVEHGVTKFVGPAPAALLEARIKMKKGKRT
jgi:hypothetical protein